MNTLAAPFASTADTETAKLCFHCGLAVPASADFRISFDGRTRSLCCVGCEAVARTIIDAGLDGYYRNRTGAAAKPAATADDPAQRQVDALFDLASVQSDYVASSDARTHKADLYVDGITCAACVWLAESALARVPGVTDARVNQVTHRASVSWDASATNLNALQSALRRVGLGAQPATAHGRFEARRLSRRRALIELGVALLSMMQVMMFTVPLYFYAADEVDAETRTLMGWAGLVLTLPVLLYSARSFFIGAWRDLQIRRVGMDLPIALAIIATFATSALSLVSGGGDLYFDSISMFVFLLLAARYLESSARESSLQLIERLTNAAPSTALRMDGYPLTHREQTVAGAELRAGDVIRVASGEAVAADGLIVDGTSTFDESLLTGESRPVTRDVGAALIAGSLNLGHPVLLRVTKTGEATVAAGLRRLTEQALAARPHLSQIADRYARWIAPLTLVLALGAALGWLLIDPAKSFPVAVAVLAVTCPCALALAAPAAQAIATARLAREGLLITRAGALDKIAAASDIVFDKTGTLTEGVMSIERIQLLSTMDKAHVLAIGNALEAGSPHPIARALKEYGLQYGFGIGALEAAKMRSDGGAGVAGTIDGVDYRLGKIAYVASLVGHPVPASVPGDATLFLGRPGQWLAAIAVADAIKSDAVASVLQLRNAGLSPHILSGDREDRVASVAETVEVPRQSVRAEQSPQQKLDYALSLQKDDRIWIAVGDGINDAPLMAAASVSIAIGSGADLTRLTADAVLLSPHLSPLVSAREVATKMHRVIRQNFAWAIAYNLIAVPFAVAGFISPAWAAIGMASSSLIVVANSMRLLRRRPSESNHWKS